MRSSPIARIESRFFAGAEFWIKRDDLLHPIVSGNKYRKLKYTLPLAQGTGANVIISMGGPWSNHLHALAHACKAVGLRSIGLVRGLRQPNAPLTATLTECVSAGMELHFVSREDYRKLREDPNYWRQILTALGDQYSWLPEGGSSTTAIQGIEELVQEITLDLKTEADIIICPCGTGTTLAGIVAGMKGNGKALGIAAVQNADYLVPKVKELLQTAGSEAYVNFEIFTQFDHGGFAKTTPALLDFCREFTLETSIPIEPVYTGKMMYAVTHLVSQAYFHPRQKVVLLHTGGLQGSRGFVHLNSR